MSIFSADARNADQVAYWNGPAGKMWTERQDQLDQVFAAVSAALIQASDATLGEHVLDVGCGCGATSIEIVAHVGASGSVLGVDISEQMLARARQRAPSGAPVTFLHADATTHVFKPASVDLLVSRFGVMFFAEPLMAAYTHVPKLPEVGPDDPGPFAFQSEERVQRILREAGYADVTMTPVDLTLDVARGQGLEAAVQNVLEIGPAYRALIDQPDAARAAATAEIRTALAALQVGQTVPLGAAIWVVGARVG
jgi:SAM-dependent methyltransferase